MYFANHLRSHIRHEHFVVSSCVCDGAQVISLEPLSLVSPSVSTVQIRYENSNKNRGAGMADLYAVKATEMRNAILPYAYLCRSDLVRQIDKPQSWTYSSSSSPMA